jgi:hypothetical protein
MEYPMGDVIVLDQVEDLGLVDVARIGERVEDPVRVEGKALPVTQADLFFLVPPNRCTAQACAGGEPVFFGFIQAKPERPEGFPVVGDRIPVHDLSSGKKDSM